MAAYAYVDARKRLKETAQLSPFAAVIMGHYSDPRPEQMALWYEWLCTAAPHEILNKFRAETQAEYDGLSGLAHPPRDANGKYLHDDVRRTLDRLDASLRQEDGGR